MKLFRGAGWPARAGRIAVTLVMGAGLAVVTAQAAPAAGNGVGGGPSNATVGRPVHADTSPPLRDIPSSGFGNGRVIRPEHEPPSAPTGGSPDPVVQSSTTSGSATPSASQSFEGVGQGFTGPAGTFSVQYAPPDTNGDVGPNNYVQIVNVGLAIFDKTGKVLLGPIPTNTIFKNFGGGCESNNDGDATVKYDRLANRWLISQFSVSTQPYMQCLAVSTSGDPTGSYNRFSFAMGSNFPDYPKLGVWSDGYYTTFNMFSGNTFVGAEVCSYNRAALTAGQPDTASASQVCVTPSGAASILPADLDGTTAPPASSPNYLMSYGTNSLNLWKFDVNWSNPASPTWTLSPKTSISVAAFTAACNGGTCVPQYGTSEKLDSLADRMMYRLAYRNLGGVERLVVSHAVNPGAGNSAVRWYEIRTPNGTPTVYQQGTYNPDSSYRWMSSAAMDGAGDIAVGYSVSSGSMNPAIRYASRQSTDTLGTLGSEVNLISGTGSQTVNLSRWGDYSSMAVDPSDDCTFWYTTEYLTSYGTWNWHTRVGTFKVPTCGSSPDFSVSLAPTSQTVNQGTTASYTATVTSLNGYAGTVNLISSPSGVSPTSLTLASGQSLSATLNINTTTMTGTNTVSVTGTDSNTATLAHTATATLTVNAPDFSVSLAPSSQTVTQGATASYNATITPLNGFAGTVNLTSSPSGVSPSSVTLTGGVSASATLTFSTAGMTVGTNPVSVTGTAGTLTHTASSSVTVSDFSVSLSPSSQSVTQGGTASYTVTVAPVSGYTGTVNLSTTSTGGSVSPTSLSFTNGSPSSATATLSIATTSSTPTGTSPVAVTGTDSVVNTLAHTANASLTVNAPPVGDFAITATPTTRTVSGGGSTTYVITIAPSGGFTGTVSLAASAPGNVKRSLSPTSVAITSTTSQNSTLTASSSKRGTFTITVTASAGSLSHSVSVTLIRQ